MNRLRKEVFEVKPDFVGEEWAGTWTVNELTALELIEVDEELIEAARRKGVEPTFDLKTYNLLLLSKSVRKNGKKVKLEELKRMPAKLYRLIYDACQKLNMITPEEERFLRKK